MATILNSAQVSAVIKADLANVVDLGTVMNSVSWSPSYSFGDGTGADQAKIVFTDERTLAASANESLDLAGGLTDAFGQAITFTKIKAIAIKAAAGNTNNVEVGGAASNAFLLFKDATDVLPVRPGGMALIVAPDAAGIAVTAGTGDLLKVANSGGGTGVTYQIAILGVV